MTRTWFALVLMVGVNCTDPLFEGPPTLEVGTGEFDFEPVEPDQRLPVVRGPQGGYHVWFGVRTTGMDPREVQLDSQLYRAPVEPDDPTQPEAPYGESFLFFVRLFEGAAVGEWVTAGLPHQVDRSEVVGRRHRLEVTATDRDGRTATDSMRIVPVREP